MGCRHTWARNERLHVNVSSVGGRASDSICAQTQQQAFGLWTEVFLVDGDHDQMWDPRSRFKGRRYIAGQCMQSAYLSTMLSKVTNFDLLSRVVHHGTMVSAQCYARFPRARPVQARDHHSGLCMFDRTYGRHRGGVFHFDADKGNE